MIGVYSGMRQRSSSIAVSEVGLSAKLSWGIETSAFPTPAPERLPSEETFQ